MSSIPCIRGFAAVVAVVAGTRAVAAPPTAQAGQRPAGLAGSAASVRAATLPATGVPYTVSRIAWTGSKEVIAAADRHGDLYYFWHASGTSTWHKQLVVGATTKLAYSKPSITRPARPMSAIGG
jgi:hypothetical protein